MESSSTPFDQSADSQMDRLTVPEAATLLGVTQAAIYKRISRGKIPHDKDDTGHVYVYLDISDIDIDKPTDKSADKPGKSKDTSADNAETSRSVDLIEELKAHNETLRQEVEAWREEARRKDAILMTMAQRIPELEPPHDTSPEPRESSETDTGEPYSTHAPPIPEHPVEERPSWWRRFFGLE